MTTPNAEDWAAANAELHHEGAWNACRKATRERAHELARLRAASEPPAGDAVAPKIDIEAFDVRQTLTDAHEYLREAMLCRGNETCICNEHCLLQRIDMALQPSPVDAAAPSPAVRAEPDDPNQPWRDALLRETERGTITEAQAMSVLIRATTIHTMKEIEQDAAVREPRT